MDIDRIADYVLIWAVLGLLVHFIYFLITG